MVCATRKARCFPATIAMTPEGSPASKSQLRPASLNQVIRFEILNAKHQRNERLPTINTASATRIPIPPASKPASHLTTTVWWCADLNASPLGKTFTQQTRWRSGGVEECHGDLNNPAAAGPNTIPTSTVLHGYAPTRWSGQCWLTRQNSTRFDVSGRLKQIQFEGIMDISARNSRAANHQYMVPPTRFDTSRQ